MREVSTAEVLTPLAVGDKVLVVANTDPKLVSYVGKRGVVTGSITPFSCRVKIVGGMEYCFDRRELEKQ